MPVIVGIEAKSAFHPQKRLSGSQEIGVIAMTAVSFHSELRHAWIKK